MSNIDSSTIIMNDKDRERWYGPLAEYYRKKGIDESSLKDTIEEIFKEAQIGWPRAPHNLDTRIKIKSGYQWKSHANLSPRVAGVQAEEIVEEESDIDVSDNYVMNSLNQSEKEWWKNREAEYIKDFDFNNSSDKMLLQQLLVEELLQRRVFVKQLKEKDHDYGKMMNDAIKRISEIQQRLGITREQRAGILDNVDGNVAQLALALDKKLEVMPELMKKQYEEELYYENIKSQRPPNNILPPIEKIEALLQVDGKLSANLDSQKISEITETVAKEVENSAPLKRIELAEGLDVSS